MVQPADIQSLLENHIPGCEADVQIDGSHVIVRVVRHQFEGLNTLKKQQLVYGALHHLIADGSVHAVHMQTLTTAEWQAKQS